MTKNPLLLKAGRWRTGALGADPNPSSAFVPLYGVTPNAASMSVSGFASYLDAVQHYETAFGGGVIYRTFSSGAIGTWSSGQVATVNQNTNATVWHSWKTWDEAAALAWMQNKPDNGLPALLSFHHEPENDGWSTAQIATWQQRTSRLMELKAQAGRDDILCGIITMGPWTLSPASGRDFWRDWYVGPPVPGYTPVGYPTGYNQMDFMGHDPYNGGKEDTPPVYDDPKTVMLDNPSYSVFDVHRVTGVPIAIGEHGSPVLSWDTDRAGMIDWVDKFQQSLLDFYSVEGIKCVANCYWSDQVQPNGWDYRMHNEPLVLAQMAQYVAESRNHYGIAGI